MVDDITPIHGHRSDLIAAQLEEAVKGLGCAGVLLDFQRQDSQPTAALAAYLTGALPCPVAVSDGYAQGLACPVFLSAPPCHEPLPDWFAPWQGREIWLELSKSPEIITVTEGGARISALPQAEGLDGGFFERNLLCHYQQEVRDREAVFTLHRTEEDLIRLLAEGESYGMTQAVGLYQELSALS